MRAFARAKLRPADVCDVEPCGTFDYKLLYYHTAYPVSYTHLTLPTILG